MKFLHFFQLWVIFALLDMNPDPAGQNQCGSFRIWIHITCFFSSGSIRLRNRIHMYVKVGWDEGELREEGAGPPEGQDAEHPAAQHCRHTRILLFNHIVTYISSRRAKFTNFEGEVATFFLFNVFFCTFWFPEIFWKTPYNRFTHRRFL